MFRLIFITILFLILPLQSMASDSYVVRIAVYKNVDSLQEELNKLSPSLRKTIIVQERGKDHVACSLHTEDKKTLQKLLPSYKEVFPDAFISTYQNTETPPTKIGTLQTKVKTPSTKEKEILPHIMKKKDTFTYSRKIINPTKDNLPLIDRIKQKTLYLCAYGKEIGSPNVLMHVAFFDNEVVYTPIMGDVPAKREKYTTKDNKIYISYKGVFDSETYSTLDSVTDQYYLISTWVGKDQINTLRYYFDLENAEAYVSSLK